jgi:WD40 repeat protein
VRDEEAKPVAAAGDPAAGDPAAGEAAPAPPAPETTRVIAEWKHSSSLIACRFDPAGRYVFAGCQHADVVRWSVEKGEATAFSGHRSWVRAIAFHPQGEVMVTGGFEGDLIWWPVSAERPEPLRIVPAHQGWVRAVHVSPAGDIAASCGNDHLVRLWSFADGKLLRTLAGHDCHVYNLAFHPAGAALVSADLKGAVREWDVASGEVRRLLDASAIYKYDDGFRADIGGVRAMRFSPDGKLLACGGITNVSNAFAGVGNPMVVVFDWEKGEVVEKHVVKESTNGVAWGAAFHAAGFLIGACGGGSGGFLLFWRRGQAEEFHKLALPSAVRDLDLHPDGVRLALAHYDHHLRLARMG